MTLHCQPGCPEHGPDIHIESFACDGVSISVIATVTTRESGEDEGETIIRPFVFPVPTLDEPLEDETFNVVFGTLMNALGSYIAECLEEEAMCAVIDQAGQN